jgi:hypothetical protein
MKTEAIPNQYDGPRKPEKRLGGGYFSLDYASSENAKEIDAGIWEIIKDVVKSFF